LILQSFSQSFFGQKKCQKRLTILLVSGIIKPESEKGDKTMIFFRAQHKGILFAKMMRMRSELEDGTKAQGVCCTLSASGLEGGARFGGSLPALADDDEIVVFRGRKIEQIYDGYIAKPIEEIARFSVKRWLEMLDSGEAYNYEEWA